MVKFINFSKSVILVKVDNNFFPFLTLAIGKYQWRPNYVCESIFPLMILVKSIISSKLVFLLQKKHNRKE